MRYVNILPKYSIKNQNSLLSAIVLGAIVRQTSHLCILIQVHVDTGVVVVGYSPPPTHSNSIRRDEMLHE